MAGGIKGITVEIGGDTTKLGKALKEASTESKGLQSELKGVNSLLKLDPTNITLLKQKQDLLTKSIDSTKTKLEALKQAQAKIDSGEVEVSEEAYRNLEREIASTENRLRSLNDQQRQFGSAGAQYIAQVGEKVKDVGGKVEDLGKKFSALSAVTGAVLTGSTKLASDFENGVAKVGTVADLSSVSLDTLSKDMLNLSTETGKSATEITDATYQAISASVDTADAVGFVSTATKLAKAGFLETADSVDVLTTIINAYGMSADDAEDISNKLVQTQNKGKTTVQELASSMGNVIPTASAYGVGLDQLCASYVELTKQGISTDNATTMLNAMFTELADGGTTVAKTLKEKTGKSFGECMSSGMSLGEVIGILSDSVEGNSEQFANLWGNVRAGKGALGIANAGTEEYSEALAGMADCTENVGNALELLDTPSVKANKAINAVKNAGIELGETVLSGVSPMLEKLSTTLQNLSNWFGGLSPQIQQTIVIVLGVITAVGPLLIIIGKIITAVGTIMTIVPAIVSAINTVKAGMIAFNAVLMANPIILIIAGITALIAGFVLLYNKCEWFRDGVNNICSAVVGFFKGMVDGIVTFFTETIPNAFTSFFNKVKSIFSTLKDFVVNNWKSLLLLLNPATMLVGIFKLVYDNCAGFREWVNNFVQAIKQFFIDAWNNIVQFFTVGIPTFISNVIEWLKALPYNIGALIGTIIGNIILFGANVIAWVTTNVPLIVSNVITFLSELPGKIWNVLTTAFNNVVTWGANMIAKAIEVATNFVTNTITFFSQLPGKIRDAIASAISNVATWGSNLISTGVEKASEMVSSIGSTLSAIPGKIWDAIVGAIEKVGTWGSNMLSTAKEKMGEVVEGIIDCFTSLPGKFVEIGKNIIEGIKSGIAGAVGGLYDGIKDSLGGLVDKAKDALGIHSPSRVFANVVGKQIPAGIGVGIEDNTDLATDAVDDLTSGLTDQALSLNGATINRQLNTTFKGQVDGVGSISDVMGTIKEYGEKLIQASKRQIVLDTGTLVGETVDQYDQALASNQILRARGV